MQEERDAIKWLCVNLGDINLGDIIAVKWFRVNLGVINPRSIGTHDSYIMNSVMYSLGILLIH